MKYEFYLTDSLEKVFPNRRPSAMRGEGVIHVFKGEIPAAQLVYRREAGVERKSFELSVQGFPSRARLRDVELVPSAYPCGEETDDNYLTTEPGLFPDLLVPKKDAVITPFAGQYRAVWIDFPCTENVGAGDYAVTVRIEEPGQQNPAVCLSFRIVVSDAALPPQTLIHSEWFHSDCIAGYYHVPVFSDAYWEAVEKQIALAAELGVNMLLTPVFTPPLDTAVGGERETVQLVDIALLDGKWSFGFEKLKKWCTLLRKYGITYLEIAHLFTQWGAKATPKIVVTTKSGPEKLFGWHVAADDPGYRDFLQNFLPALEAELLRLGYDKNHVIFHISDEPSSETADSYRTAQQSAADLLEGWKIFDALSSTELYEQGVVVNPIPSVDHVQAFVDRGATNLWTYYCCAQTTLVPNRFFAMPSARNRIMGVLMYLYDIKGFLQWGFNFYSASLSRFPVDPYFDTHAGYAFPSGDAFLVYPGPDGEPRSSIRGEVQREGFSDLRALRLLESRIGRDEVVKLIRDGYDKEEFTFTSYPREAEYFFDLRARIASLFR